jgi:uncharacterized protein YndB with AHSA1/START domain
MGGSGSKHTLTTPSDTEIVMTRTFDAPRELVFEAHSSCEHMSKWWGPRKYEVSECDIDFRIGGTWRIVHSNEDGRHEFRGEYREIVAPERFSWTFEYMGMPGQIGLETYEFSETAGVTTLTSTAYFDTAETRDMVLKSGMEEGAIETWERLDEHLETLKQRR